MLRKRAVISLRDEYLDDMVVLVEKQGLEAVVKRAVIRRVGENTLLLVVRRRSRGLTCMNIVLRKLLCYP